jgi:uncharacterized protein (TIGR00730 family)
MTTDPDTYLCVYCGSKVGDDPAYLAAAKTVGAGLARRNVGLVYGGGSVGLMGAAANACLELGGTVVGVIPRDLFEEERVHEKVTHLVVTDGMHERKLAMTERSNAFLVLPGGFGTMDETFEALTWRHLGIHHKPIGLLDVNGFYEPFVHMEGHMRDRGFVAKDAYSPLVDDDPDRMIDALMAAAAAAMVGPPEHQP